MKNISTLFCGIRVVVFASLTFILFHLQSSAQPCNGVPVTGNTHVFQNPVCSGNNFTVVLMGLQFQGGLIFQWASSLNGVNFNPIPGPQGTQPQLQTSITQPTYFHCTVTCTNTGQSATSNDLLVNVISPTITYPPANVTLNEGESTHPDNTGYATFETPCCDGLVTYSDATSSNCCQLIITRTWTIVDCHGEGIQYVQTINVILDSAAPVITCATLGPGACNTTPTPDPGSVTVTDECPGTLTVTTSTAAGSSPCEVVTTFTWAATDQCGHSATCTQTVSTIMDSESPVITCPSPVSLPCNTTPSPDASSISATDNCGPPSITLTGSSSSTTGCLVTYTFTWRATDACGNFTECQQVLTSIHDVTPPVITCPGESELCNATPSPSASTITATDNCGSPVISLVNTSTGTVGCFTTYVFTWRATDDCGNFSDCDQIIYSIMDETDPVITCPAPSMLPCNNTPVASSSTITATDNCAPPVVTLEGTSIASVNCTTTYTFTWRATDICGNFSECEEEISSIMDLVPPEIICPPADTLCNVTPSPNIALISATDNCGAPVITYMGSIVSTVDCVTRYTFKWRATDDCGNFSECVEIYYVINDLTPPVISDCPNSQSVPNEDELCGAYVSWTPPTATDNCFLVSFTSSHAPGSFFPVGSTTVTYIAKDSCGNETICTFIIDVNDVEPPWNINCPGVIIQDNDPGSCGAFVTWNVTATDNCGVASIVSVPASGGFFDVGVTPVLVTVTDVNGNTWTCSFNVHVNDNEKPVFINCPNNIVQNADPGECVATILIGVPDAEDNCDVASVVEITPVMIDYPVGVTTVKFKATDIYGNFEICTVIVTIIDNQPPTINNCPADIDVVNDPTLCKAEVTWIEPTAEDNCEILSFVRSHPPGSDFPVGVTTVTYTATDIHGNITVCEFDIDVDDEEDPFILSHDIVTCDTVVFYDFIIGDNCGLDEFSYSPPSGSNFVPGTTTVVYVEAWDIHGNFNFKYFNVTILVPPSEIDAVVSDESIICLGDSVEITAFFDTLGTNGKIKIYKDACDQGSVVDSNSVADNFWSVKVWPDVAGEVTYYVRIEGDCDTTDCFPVTVTVNACPSVVTLELNVFLQGFYTGGGLMDNSGAGGYLYVAPVSGATPDDVDTLSISVMNPTSPYSLVEMQQGILQTNGNVSVTCSNAVVAGNSYYIKVDHQNSIETWSAAPVLFSPLTVYSFTSAAAQAYGSNMAMTFDLLYFAIHSGDINKDGAVDGSDFLELDPKIQNGEGGYNVGDLNGDGAVDGSDFLVLDPNIQVGVGAAIP